MVPKLTDCIFGNAAAEFYEGTWDPKIGGRSPTGGQRRGPLLRKVGTSHYVFQVPPGRCGAALRQRGYVDTERPWDVSRGLKLRENDGRLERQRCVGMA